MADSVENLEEKGKDAMDELQVAEAVGDEQDKARGVLVDDERAAEGQGVEAQTQAQERARQLEQEHRQLVDETNAVKAELTEAWDELGKAERELFKVGNTEAEILGKMQERERVIEAQAQSDFKRLRSAEQELEEAGFFSRSAKREALEQVKAEVQGKYHGASEAYEGMKWAKETDEELSLWDKQLADVRARKAGLVQDSADARLRIEKADGALKQVQGKAEAVKQERVQVDPVLRAQKVRGAGAARELAGSRGADVQRGQGMVR